MTIKAECERCKAQQETERAVVKVAPGLLSRVEVPLPEGWRRVDIPMADRKAPVDRVELCPECVNALRLWLVKIPTPEEIPGLVGLGEPEDGDPVFTEDPRPNLTARAEALSSAEAMEAIRTGERAGQLLTCPEKAAQAAECSGWYERGRLTAHMQDAHGGGGGRGRCPYCAHHGPAPMIGQHVAADHPGQYEEWRSGGQRGI